MFRAPVTEPRRSLCNARVVLRYVGPRRQSGNRETVPSPDMRCVSIRGNALFCCHGEELHSQDVHLPVLHLFLLPLLRGLLSRQVRPMSQLRCRTDVDLLTRGPANANRVLLW